MPQADKAVAAADKFQLYREADGSLLGPFIFPEWGFPDPANAAEQVELSSLFGAIEAAGDRFRMLSLGAAPGEWAIRAERAYRKQHPTGDYATINVEADLTHVLMIEDFLTKHNCDLSRNTILFASVTPIDGWSFFPIIDKNDWGAGVVSFSKDFSDLDEKVVQSENSKNGRQNGFKAVMAISLDRLLGMTGVVDFLHCDIQGAEGDIFPPGMDTLSASVKVCCISIHATAINTSLKAVFAAAGWTLETEVPGHFVEGPNGEECHKDGVLLLKNPRFA